ncbi:MAG: hypothetical protein LBL81_04005 [Tannerella sp.]|jgi:hypothetical protein|nr:hypothetical protein [Tannerella sp.]
MNIKCPNCKLNIEIEEEQYEPGSILKMSCPRCDEALSIPIPRPQKKAEVIPPPPVEEEPPAPAPAPAAPAQPTPTPVAPAPAPAKKGGNGKLIALVGLLFVVAAAVFGGFYYHNVYLPAKIDREAPRYYTFADATVLRSSEMAGANFNKIGSIPYGSELITYDYGTDWSRVKYEGNKGYVASNFLLDKEDFFLLNGIFGDQESRQCVATAKCRRALLSYYKQKGLTGEQWQVFCRPANVKPNNVCFPRLRDKYSKFTDFAVVIKNLASEHRRLLIFGFQDDETPFLIGETDAPDQGYIKSMSVGKDKQVHISWTTEGE